MATKKLGLLGFNDLAGAATLSASGSDAAFSLTNLENDRLGSRWHSDGLSSVHLQADLGSSKSVTGVALIGSNFRDETDWRIRQGDDASFAAHNHDSGTVDVFDSTTYPPLVEEDPPWGRTALYLPSSTWAGRYVRVNLTDASHPDGYFAAGALRIGEIWQPGINFEAESWEMEDEFEGPAGAEVPYRMHRLTLHRLTRAEMIELKSALRWMRMSQRVVLVPQATEEGTWLTEVVWGTLEDTVRTVPTSPKGNLWSVRFEIREVGW